MPNVNWSEAIKPLLKKYKDKKHPLDYGSVYQLLVMVVLSAQDSDKHINQIAPKFFAAFPNMETLSQATPGAIQELISDVRNFANKSKWLSELSKKTKKDKNKMETISWLFRILPRFRVLKKGGNGRHSYGYL